MNYACTIVYKSIEMGYRLQHKPIFGRPKPIAILQIPVFRTIPDYLAFEMLLRVLLGVSKRM